MECLRCQHRELIPRYWLNRRGGVRCSACGGPLDLSDAGKDAMAEAIDHLRDYDAPGRAYDRKHGRVDKGSRRNRS